MITIRQSISILFFVNGLLIGNWAPKIPVFASRLFLDESAMGLMIAVFGFGALTAMPLTGVAIARLGVRSSLYLSSLVAAPTILWLSLAGTSSSAFIVMFIAGASISSMDVAMNSAAVNLEKTRAHPIMSSCHGWWSIGGLMGAIMGGYLLEHHSTTAHAVVVSLLALTLTLMALPNVPSGSQPSSQTREAIKLPRCSYLPYLLGLLALFSAMPEGAVIDWSAFYLRQELKTNTFVSSLAFAVFSGAMALVRFLGDSIRYRYGTIATFRLSAIIAATGLLSAGMAASSTMAILGFFIAGLGMANLIPIAFSVAGNLPGQAPSINISIVTSIGYSGILVAPALIGYIASKSQFSYTFMGLAGLLFIVALGSPTLKAGTIKETHST